MEVRRKIRVRCLFLAPIQPVGQVGSYAYENGKILDALSPFY
jgi:hypothetical protein